MRTLIIGLFILTSCQTYQRKQLAFIVPSTISFSKSEIKQIDKLKRNDIKVYNKNDSFNICSDYKQIKPILNSFYKEMISEYYFINSNKDLIDHITLEYYGGDLYSVCLFTKGKSRVDSLSKCIQTFYNKKFKESEGNKHEKQSSYFQKGKMLVDYTIYCDNYEAMFMVTNNKVKVPSWCGTKTPWWYYLMFWQW